MTRKAAFLIVGVNIRSPKTSHLSILYGKNQQCWTSLKKLIKDTPLRDIDEEKGGIQTHNVLNMSLVL